MHNLLVTALFLLSACSIAAPVEIHQRLRDQPRNKPVVALTLDACSGPYDHRLIEFLIQNRIQATIFVTKRWIEQNPVGVSVLRSNLDLFDIENHGENHIPAVVGMDKRVYGILGEPDLLHLEKEVLNGALAIKKAFGVEPRFYRAATAEYDSDAVIEIRKLGFKIAGFSINGDEGATLHESEIERRVRGAKDGDVIIAHMNKPYSSTFQGLSASLPLLIENGFEFTRLDQVELIDQRP